MTDVGSRIIVSAAPPRTTSRCAAPPAPEIVPLFRMVVDPLDSIALLIASTV